MFRKRLPEGHMKIVDAESIYGAILGALGRPGEAEPLLVESFAAMQRVEERAPERLRALARVIEFYEAYENPTKVAEYVALRDESCHALDSRSLTPRVDSRRLHARVLLQ